MLKNRLHQDYKKERNVPVDITTLNYGCDAICIWLQKTHFSQADTTALSSGFVLRIALQPVSCSCSPPSPPPGPPPPPPAPPPPPPPCSPSMSRTWCGCCCIEQNHKMFHMEAYYTCWEKPCGCCCIVTVIFSCQEVPACSVPALLPACLMKIRWIKSVVNWKLMFLIPWRRWAGAKRTADAEKELQRQRGAGGPKDDCDRMNISSLSWYH